MKYYEKIDKWEKRNIGIQEREAEIKAAVEAGLKPPRRKPKNKPRPEYPELKQIENKEDIKQNFTFERKTLGFYLTEHPLDDYTGLCRQSQYTVEEIKQGEIDNNETINIPIVISSIIEKRTKKGDNMAILNVEDKTARIEATIFPRQWAKIKGSIQEDSVGILNGKVRVSKSDDENAPPIVRLTINKISEVKEDIAGGKMHPVSLVLNDGSEFTFHPKDDLSYSAFQQAISIASNMRKMG